MYQIEKFFYFFNHFLKINNKNHRNNIFIYKIIYFILIY